MAYDQYTSKLQSYLKFTFNNLALLDQSCSQMHQDLFVLAMLNGKTHGTYLEIGAHLPIDVNNTFVLEKCYQWTGVSIEIDPTWRILWQTVRKNPLIIDNALAINYEKLLQNNRLGPLIDYLSVDIYPPEGTFQALKNIPHDKFRFNIITFEHSANIPEGIEVRNKSRDLLSNLGYELFIADVSNEDIYERGKLYPVEDWWINTDNINTAAYNALKVDTSKYIASRFTAYKDSYKFGPNENL